MSSYALSQDLHGLPPAKYSLGFTTGASLIYESVVVAKLYTALRDWAEVRAQVLNDNSFQSRTQSSLKKLYSEVARRLRHLNADQLNCLSTGDASQQKAMVWLAICRQYGLIRDFALEVIVFQFDTGRHLLTHQDYDAFFFAKAEWHKNLDEASSQTKSKARQVLFKMMRECGLLNDAGEIQNQFLSDSLMLTIGHDERNHLLLFPLTR